MQKVKQSLYRPRGFQEFNAPRFQDNQHIKVVKLSSYAQAAFTPQKIFLVFISVRGLVDSKAIVRPEVLCQRKIPMTSGIEPTTFRFVAQCLTQLCHRVPFMVCTHQYYLDVNQSSEDYCKIWNPKNNNSLLNKHLLV